MRSDLVDGDSICYTTHDLVLTAFNSPKLSPSAKCALRLAFELPAATPHRALRMLEKPRRSTLGVLGKAGERQSSIIAESLNTSAARRYILHSGSNAVPSLWANRIVAMRPMESCTMESNKAAVGDADASPTPTPALHYRASESIDNGTMHTQYLGAQLWMTVAQQSKLKMLATNPKTHTRLVAVRCRGHLQHRATHT